MCNKDTVTQQIENMGSYLLKRRGVRHHVIINAGKRGNITGNTAAGIHQRVETSLNLLAIRQNDSYFSNATGSGVPPSGLNVYNGVHHLKLALKNQKSGQSRFLW